MKIGLLFASALALTLVSCAVAQSGILNTNSGQVPSITLGTKQGMSQMPQLEPTQVMTTTIATPAADLGGLINAILGSEGDATATPASPDGQLQDVATATPEVTAAPEATVAPEVSDSQVVTLTNGTATIVIDLDKMYILEKKGDCADWSKPGHTLIEEQQNGGFWSYQETFIFDGQVTEKENGRTVNVITGKWVDKNGDEVNPCTQGT